MKKTYAFLFSFIIMVCASLPAHSIAINDPWAAGSSELNLRDIWNSVLKTDFTGSSMDLFNAYGVGRDNQRADWWWNETNGLIQADVRYAGYAQSFGIVTAEGRTTTIANNIPWGINTGLSFSFDVQSGAPFTWFEKWTGGGTQGQWYSNSLMNADGKDHFVAFEVPESLYNINDGKGRMYMLAFEDLSMGDADYQDLVVFARSVSPAPVPEPASMALLGVGLMSLGFMKRKFKTK